MAIVQRKRSKRGRASKPCISVSTPIPLKNRCKKCGSFPHFHYLIRKSILWFSPYKAIKHQFNDTFLRYYRRLNENPPNAAPEFWSHYHNNAHPVFYKGFNPKLHRSKGTSPIGEFIEVLECKCGESTWVFSEMFNTYKLEILHRKSDRYCPLKIEWL